MPTACGMLARSAAPCETAGSASEPATSATSVITASPRGGLVRASVMRWIWIHIISSSSSGMAMCRNTISVKNRLDSMSGARKLRAIGSAKIPSVSRSSVVTMATYCASRSQTSQ